MVKSEDVLAPPPGLSRIATHSGSEADYSQSSQKLRIDATEGSEHCRTPSPTAEGPSYYTAEAAGGMGREHLVDALIEETVSDMLLGDRMF